jgi:ATP-binding cassette subfamily F protein 3
LLLISHDRDFLDNVVDHIAHLEQHRINLYNGDYSAFERQRAERLAQQQATYEKQQRERAHLRAFIDRFRAKATKARQAQSRIKALNRMEQVSAAHVDSPFHFEFAIPEKLPNPLLTLDSVAVGYGDSTILSQVSLVITPGTRLGLLGPNGAGKSTLVKLLAGVLDPLKGRLEFGQGLSVGYFAQHQLEQLRPEWGALQHLRKLTPDANEQALRDFLGGFGFAGDRALAPVAPFSGGEKARLALAILVWQRPNLLLLDEPTNHLDLDMRHALNRALQAYEGGLIVVSHDRHLLRTSTDAFALVADGGFVPFDGDLEDYASWLNGRRGAAVSPGAKKPGGGAIERRDRKRVAADKRAQLGLKRRPLNQRARALEEMMDRLNTEKARIELALTAPDIYDDAHKSRLRELLRRQGEVSRELEQHESEWLDLQEALEALDV